MTRVERMAEEIAAALSALPGLPDVEKLTVEAIWTPHGIKVLVQPTIRITGSVTGVATP